MLLSNNNNISSLTANTNYAVYLKFICESQDLTPTPRAGGLYVFIQMMRFVWKFDVFDQNPKLIYMGNILKLYINATFFSHKFPMPCMKHKSATILSFHTILKSIYFVYV